MPSKRFGVVIMFFFFILLLFLPIFFSQKQLVFASKKELISIYIVSFLISLYLLGKTGSLSPLITTIIYIYILTYSVLFTILFYIRLHNVISNIRADSTFYSKFIFFFVSIKNYINSKIPTRKEIDLYYREKKWELSWRWPNFVDSCVCEWIRFENWLWDTFPFLNYEDVTKESFIAAAKLKIKRLINFILLILEYIYRFVIIVLKYTYRLIIWLINNYYKYFPKKVDKK